MGAFIVCVHATPRAVGPAAELLAQRPGYRHQDMLEPGLLEHAQAVQRGRELFARVLAQAATLRPDAILTTCSMYTRFLPALRSTLARPVLGIDEPMIDAAAGAGGRLALVGSIPEAIEQTAGLIRERAQAMNRVVSINRTLLLAPGAAEAGREADEAVSRIDAIAREVEMIVIVQLSLSRLAKRLAPDVRRRTLTSFDTALSRLDAILDQETRA